MACLTDLIIESELLDFQKCSLCNSLKAILEMKNIYQPIGALLMLLSSIAFFIMMMCSQLQSFPFNFCLVATVTGFFLGIILTYRMQKITPLFFETIGINMYIIGWAFIINSLLLSNTYLELYFYGLIGVYIVFIGIVFYFLYKKNPAQIMMESHIVVGSFLVLNGSLTVFFVCSEITINLFDLVMLGPLSAFWLDKGIVSVMVGFGLLLISLFMYHLHPSLEDTSDSSSQLYDNRVHRPLQMEMTVNPCHNEGFQI